MTRAKALLLSLAVFVLGGAGYWGFSAAGFEEFDAGIAASVVSATMRLDIRFSCMFSVNTARFVKDRTEPCCAARSCHSAAVA